MSTNVTRLDEVITPSTAARTNSAVEKKSKKKNRQKPYSPVDVILMLVERHELFAAPDGTPYAAMDGVVVPIDSQTYRSVLARDYFAATGYGASRAAIADAAGTIMSIAQFGGDVRDVYLRIGQIDGTIYIDQGTADYRMISVTPTGWRWVSSDEHRPMMRRGRAMRPMPLPQKPDFSRLWRYLPAAPEHRPLIASFLLAALRPHGPYPICFLSGEQGAGKSTAARILVSLCDPSAVPLRAPPKDIRDLMVGAVHSRVLAIDNMSAMSPHLSDALCRIATGGAISERALYSNTDEVLIELQRPVVITGIEDLATRPDLAERGLHIELGTLAARRTESEYWTAFAQDSGHIYGALLDGLVAAMGNCQSVHITELPRMADFAQFAAAGMEPLGFSADEFIRSYKNNLKHGMSVGLEASPIGTYLVDWIRDVGEWHGTATELLHVLSRQAGAAAVRAAGWPQSPRGLSNAIRRLTTALRHQRVCVSTARTSDSRMITLRRM